MVSQHCPSLKQSWNLYYFSFFLKSPQMHLLPLSSCETGKHIPHFSWLCKDKLCSVWEIRRWSQGKTEEERKCRVFQKPEPGAAEQLCNSSWRLLFARTQQMMQRSPLHCHPTCSLNSTISFNHILTPNISWTATETLHLPLQRLPEVLLFPK